MTEPIEPHGPSGPIEPPDVAHLEALIGAYALDAVDADEHVAVEAHLAECPRCRAELAEHLETATFLAHGGAPAPDGLWSRIASSLEESPPALRLGVVDGEGVRPARVSDDARDRRPRSRTIARTALAVAAALVFSVMAVQLVRQGNQIDDLQSHVAAEGLSHAAMQALADPDSQKVDLTSPTGAKMSATAVISPDGTGYLVPSDLPKLAADRTYQLWAVMPGHVISLGLLGSSPTITAFPGNGTIKGLAVTDEVAGGVPASSNQPVLVGQA
jgi:anti-sigma factor RsiW